MDSLTVIPLASLDEEHGFVTAIHAEGEIVVVGTSRGQLLRLEAPDNLSMAERPVAVCELRPEKRKHAVRELCVLGSSGVALALSDGIVTVHCLLDLTLLCQLNNNATKAETFCVNEDLPIPCVAVSVAAQRALLFFRLSNPVQLYRETHCGSPPSRMAWQGDALSLVSLAGLAVTDAALGYTVFEQGSGGGEGEEHQSRLARCHESQRWFPIKGWSSSLLPTDLCGTWSDEQGRRLKPPPLSPRSPLGPEAFSLPRDGASWAGDWVLDLAGSRDALGWRYAANFALAEWGLECGRASVVRRRAWVRAYTVTDSGGRRDGRDRELEAELEAVQQAAAAAAVAGGRGQRGERWRRWLH